jgi:hypothetical protein
MEETIIPKISREKLEEVFAFAVALASEAPPKLLSGNVQVKKQTVELLRATLKECGIDAVRNSKNLRASRFEKRIAQHKAWRVEIEKRHAENLALVLKGFRVILVQDHGFTEYLCSQTFKGQKQVTLTHLSEVAEVFERLEDARAFAVFARENLQGVGTVYVVNGENKNLFRVTRIMNKCVTVDATGKDGAE